MKDVNKELRQWWMAELKKISAKVLKEEEKRQARERERIEKIIGKMGEYHTYEDAQDAYGLGVITSRQFDRIVGLLEQAKPKESELYQAKVQLLMEMYNEQKGFLEDYERFEKSRKEATP